MTLRSLNGGDAEAVEPWLAEAVAAVDGARPAADTPGTLDEFSTWVAGRWPDAGRDAICVNGAAAGFIVWRPSSLSGNAGLQIDALAVRRDARNLGYGVEAVMRLEEAHPDTTVHAAIPRNNGLAVYFWLRAGYRPVRLEETSEMTTDADRLWMVRVPASGGL